MSTKSLSPDRINTLLDTLKARFESNMPRHAGLHWPDIQQRLGSQIDKLWSLNDMETTGGEPDVIAYDAREDKYLFVDCAAESPKARRSLCYDPEALAARKEHKPKHSAIGMAKDMGVEILDEAQYRQLQALGEFDLKTSSWVLTPGDVRAKGGAIFCDRRYGRVFTYHNGADSYYGSRGFRAILKV
jgi:hypothetical protein